MLQQIFKDKYLSISLIQIDKMKKEISTQWMKFKMSRTKANLKMWYSTISNMTGVNTKDLKVNTKDQQISELISRCSSMKLIIISNK
jgi:hypothetical protein